MFRSSRPEVFCRRGVLRNFAKFTGKYLWQSLFFNEVAGLRPAILLKKTLWHRCFAVNFVKFLRTLFFIEHLRRLLLCVIAFEPTVVFCWENISAMSRKFSVEKFFPSDFFTLKKISVFIILVLGTYQPKTILVIEIT